MFRDSKLPAVSFFKVLRQHAITYGLHYDTRWKTIISLSQHYFSIVKYSN